MSDQIVKVQLNYLRIAPRKVRLVADLIRGKYIDEAEAQLMFLNKKSSLPMLKLLKSAIASAQHDFKMKPDNLFISKLIVDEGPKFKRWMPRAFGRASEIQKKTSHIELCLKEGKQRKRKRFVNYNIKKTDMPLTEATKDEYKAKDGGKKSNKFNNIISNISPKKILSAGKKIFRRKSI